MVTDDCNLRIPYGTRDLLPGEAQHKRQMENELAKLFTAWGYDELVTPTFEYLSALTIGTGTGMSDSMFKFLDKNNRILALRPDMTTPIARIASTRLRELPDPKRLFYITNVFRCEQTQAGRQCEFYQAGVELLGQVQPAADAEIIALAIEAMLAVGLESFTVNLGQVGFVNAVMEESGLSPQQLRVIKNLMIHRDIVGLHKFLEESGLANDYRQLIADLPVSNGKQEIIHNLYNKVKNSASRAALDNLLQIYKLLTTYGLEKHIVFDLGVIRDFEYYTGMVFETYTPGLGFPLCGGGRYDKMLSGFGLECPATGFALGIERAMLALERQGLITDKTNKVTMVCWSEGNMVKAIETARELRRKGQNVKLSLVAQAKMQAETCCQEQQKCDLVFIGE